MLTIKQITNNKEEIIKLLEIKGFDAAPIIDQLVEYNERRLTALNVLEQKKAEQNKLAKDIGEYFKQKNN